MPEYHKMIIESRHQGEDFRLMFGRNSLILEHHQVKFLLKRMIDYIVKG